MQRCILCGRKISNSKYNFGLNCLKRMCNTVGIDDVKNLNGEVALNKRVLELANKKSLLKSQRQLLTDRYLIGANFPNSFLFPNRTQHSTYQ